MLEKVLGSPEHSNVVLELTNVCNITHSNKVVTNEEAEPGVLRL